MAAQQRAAAHRGGELTKALNALEGGDAAGAAEAFGDAWLRTYGLAVDAEVTDVVGAFSAAF